jgi:hypothetical protein
MRNGKPIVNALPDLACRCYRKLRLTDVATNGTVTLSSSGFFVARREAGTASRRSLLLHVVVPIFIGAAIYTCWRSTTLLVFAWYKWLHVYDLVARLRHVMWPARHVVPHWVLFSLPDGCWVYSFTVFLKSVWENSGDRSWAFFWVALPTTLAVGAEIGQANARCTGYF